MLPLDPHECRVLGVLIEKAQTTPAQYPLTLNGLVSGCNQRSNRHPVLAITEQQALDALDGLRAKRLANEVMLSGSRVAKYRHLTRDALEIGTSEVVVLAELLLRGPQTIGEIRGRASRMHPLESMEVVQEILNGLQQRETPLVRSVAPAAGSRAGRWAQMLCPDLHPVDAAPATGAAPSPPRAAAAPAAASPELAERVDRLEREVAELRRALQAVIAAHASA